MSNETRYFSELKRLYTEYSLIDLIPQAIQLTEAHFHFIKGVDRRRMLVNSLAELFPDIDQEMVGSMIDLSFAVARNKRFLRLAKHSCNCGCFPPVTGK